MIVLGVFVLYTMYVDSCVNEEFDYRVSKLVSVKPLPADLVNHLLQADAQAYAGGSVAMAYFPPPDYCGPQMQGTHAREHICRFCTNEEATTSLRIGSIKDIASTVVSFIH
jgi:hypothetical protein